MTDTLGLLSVKEACLALKISMAELQRRIAAREIVATEIGGKAWIREREIDRVRVRHAGGYSNQLHASSKEAR